jgi:hydroxymethylpyrimidine pyrophosphatase-like HAD family hydrolase
MPAALDRPFRILAFDWDGTAVPDRRAPTEDLRLRTERLAALHVWCVVITGTNFGNIDRQYFQFLTPDARRCHIACTNRGSEVYGFGPVGAPAILERRDATPAENEAMDSVAVAIRDELRRRHGLETDIVFDRMNRRKLDLIPLPEWADPPKARIGELLAAVKQRLAACGVEGGIQAILDRVAELGQQHRVRLCLTTDVKHVEFGLTDKSDSTRYVADCLAAEHGIAREDILVAGDEFGPIDGFEGSDFKTFTIPGASYVSVGKEPNGVPEGVRHVGGGAPAFLELLDRQIRLHEEAASCDRPDLARD